MAWRPRVSGIAAFAVLTASTAVALGQGMPAGRGEKVRLVYEAPKECAGREQFVGQVQRRIGTDWEASSGEMARTIHVSVSTNAERFVARMELQDSRGRAVTRAVAGARCDHVVEGIALVTTLAIQAQLEGRLDENEPGSQTLTSLDDTPAPGRGAQATQEEPVPEVRPRRSPTVPPQARSREIKLRLGARASIQQGVGPRVATGVGAFAALVWPRILFGLAGEVDWTGHVTAGVVPARFGLRALRLDACARFPWLNRSLAIEPCAFAQGGLLEARGDAAPPNVTRGSAGTALWLTPGLVLSLRGELGPVLVGLEASAGLPLNRERFYLKRQENRDVVYQVPWLTTGVALAVGVTL